MSEKKTEERLIVRIAGIDLDGRKSIERALTKIKGVGIRMGKNIAIAFEELTGIPHNTKLGLLDEEKSKKLEEIVLAPQKFNIPEWNLNRRKDFYTGESTHKVMSELDLALREDLSRLKEIKSYRGLRHQWGLPVRGQRTKSTHRGKGNVVGVMKKEVAKAAAPKPAQKQEAKKQEKKK
ncbi:MAG: 30S ribosomal protein S13 [Candidatus Diapherotrites archaeon]